MIKTTGPAWVPRALLALISLLIVLFGVGSFIAGNGILFAPVAVIIGSLGLFIAIFMPNESLTAQKKKSRFRGWPRGRNRY